MKSSGHWNHILENLGFSGKGEYFFGGPAGSGKTSTLHIIAQKVIKLGGIAISVYNPVLATIGLHLVRKIEPKRPIVGLMEDIDALVNEHGEADLLGLLDGEHQIDNAVYVATTNYPERLDPRFVNRPSRFDVVRKIGMPSTEARAVYLASKSSKLAADKKLLKQWVKDTDGLAIAHLKELIVSVEVFGSTYDASLNRLQTMMGCQASSRDFEQPVGFTTSVNEMAEEELTKILDRIQNLVHARQPRHLSPIEEQANAEILIDDESPDPNYCELEPL